MTFTTIQNCLSQNAQLLGKDYSQLGTSVKSGWFHHRVFLSFDPKKGWNVVKLNWIQLFLRRFLGFYKSTHLSTVAHAWKDCTKQKSYRNAALDERIQALRFSPKRFFSSWGNTDSADANLFLFPELHMHQAYRKTVNRYINEHYREGDVVLVEGIPAGTANRNQQVKHLKEGIQVFGWEPKNFENLIDASAITKHKKMLQKLEEFCTVTLDKNFEAIGERLDTIIAEFQELAAYFDPRVKNIKEIVKDLYQISKGKPDPGKWFRYFMLRLAEKLEKKQEDAAYNHITPKDFEKMVKASKERTLSLVSEIQKYRAQGKRVFVIAGASHLLNLPLAEVPSIPQEVHSCLHKHKFVMLADKDVMTAGVMELNKEFFSKLKKSEP